MKKLLIIIVFVPLLSFSQKQGNNWYFGYGAGLTFNSGVPVVINGGQTGFAVDSSDNQEGTSCISDSLGNLLFYTSGQTIWNRNNLIMPNGTGIMGGVSSTQSSLIVPLPGSSNIFYVFTSDEFQHYGSPFTQKGYRYSVVDMCLDRGLGDVVPGEKNILLCDSSTEKLSACEDSSGQGYWVVGHKMFSDKFYAWHLTVGGITNTVITEIGTVHGWDFVHFKWNVGAAQGQMKINGAGTKLALVISNFSPAYLDVFDFNNSTGILSNFCHIVSDSVLYSVNYGVEFSQDDSKLYITVQCEEVGNFLYQFNMKAGIGNCDSVKTSCFKVFQTRGYAPMGLQLGPDNKIYIANNNANNNTQFISCINFPNRPGPSVDFDSLAISSIHTGGYTLPSFVAGYKYHNGIPYCSVVIIEKDEPRCGPGSVTLTVSGALPGENYIWYNSLTNGTILQSNGATFITPYLTSTTTFYVATYDTATGIESSSLIPVIATIILPPTITATTPASCCDSCSLTLKATTSNGIIKWYASESDSTILGAGITFTTPTISTSTNYYVDATDAGCTSLTRTAIQANIIQQPVAGEDTAIMVCCTEIINLSIILPDILPGGIWFDSLNTGRLKDSLLNTIGMKAGKYVFTYSISDYGCKQSSAYVSVMTDTTTPVILCPSPLSVNAYFENLYSTLTNELNYIKVSDPCGISKIYNNLNSDTTLNGVLIRGSQDIVWTAIDNAGNKGECNYLLTIEDRDIPNIFTPNGDGIDDTWDFNLADVYPHAIVVVFNRWGEVVFKSDQGYNIKWDGKLNGKDLPIDGYQYVITDNDKAITKGTVTIMR